MKRRTGVCALLTVLVLLLFSGIGGRLDAHAEGWTFGDQLSGRERELYEILEEHYAALQNYKEVNGFTIQLRSPMTEQEIMTFAWFRPQRAFLMDHCDLFWISSLSFGVTAKWDMETGARTASDMVVYAVDRYSDIRSDVTSAQSELRKAIAAVKKCSGRYAKVKAAHDYVIRLTAYPKNLVPAYYHAVTGPLLKKYANQGVCEAYAWLFANICKANGIPCVILEGNNHAWNYVQMEDGKWYLVDTTWDDGGRILYDYFLVGAETTVAGKKVKQTHPAASIGELYMMNKVSPLKYPTLSKKAYKKPGSQAQKSAKVTTIKIVSSTKQVKAGKTLALKATVLPNRAANKKLKWSSSNTKYATVTGKGVVKTKKAGKGKTVRITAQATDGSGKKATIRIKIK